MLLHNPYHGLGGWVGYSKLINVPIRAASSAKCMLPSKLTVNLKRTRTVVLSSETLHYITLYYITLRVLFKLKVSLDASIQTYITLRTSHPSFHLLSGSGDTIQYSTIHRGYYTVARR